MIRVDGYEEFELPLEIQIVAEKAHYWGGDDVDIAIRGLHADPRHKLCYWAINLTLQEYDPAEPHSQEPLFRLNYKNAQYLIDSLWNAGIRPSNDEGNEGALSATKAHLEDMRTLVFKKE